MPPHHADRAAVAATLRRAGCVFADDEADLLLAAARDGATLEAMVARRAAGEPLEQVIGWVDFCGARVAVEPGVFVPRRRSEHLAREAARRAAPGAVVVDMCCGSGAVGAAVAAAVGDVRLHAVDVDPVAARCATRNLVPFGGVVHEGDLYAALPDALRGRVDVVVANAPYVPTAEIALLPAEARDHEPRRALDGGSDGADVQRAIAAGAPAWLAPGGVLLIETTRRAAAALAADVAACGLLAGVVPSAELDTAVVVGELSPR